jgi:hypothetical protein
MLRKALAAGLLVALCLGFLAVEGISQAPPPGAPPKAEPPLPPPDERAASRAEPSLEELVAKLKHVRAQQEALKQQEKQLLAQIAKKLNEQREALQKVEDLVRQLYEPAEVTDRDKRDKRKDSDKK